MYIEREIKTQFETIRKLYSLVAVVGARQAGKTTFLKESIKGMNSSYVMFDDPDAKDLFEQDIKKFEMQYMEGRDITVLDEIQYCKGAGAKLKYLAEKGKRVWITSSSETVLGKDVLSYLVGRVSILRVYPFSLKEFMVAKNQKETTDLILERNVWEHMVYGGYPKVVLTEELEGKKIILRDLYETMVLKDIAKVFSINDIRKLEDFARYVAINAGEIAAYEKMSNALDLSFQTIKKYFDAMEKSYMIRRIPPFFVNKSKEITKQPKMYFFDTGLRNAIVNEFAAEPVGKIFENYVLSELIKQDAQPKYWRTKSGLEVDFIIEKDNQVIPIEVKLTASDSIERGLRSFIRTYRPKHAVVVFYKGLRKEVAVDGCNIIFTDIAGMKEALTGIYSEQ